MSYNKLFRPFFNLENIVKIKKKLVEHNLVEYNLIRNFNVIEKFRKTLF